MHYEHPVGRVEEGCIAHEFVDADDEFSVAVIGKSSCCTGLHGRIYGS